MPFSYEAAIQALKGFSACDVSDALLKLGYRNGGFLSGPTMYSPERQAGRTCIIGRAYTVEYARNDDARPKLAKHYIDSIPKGAVVFISCPLGTPNAVYGGLMSTRAQASGAVGTVVDGRVRDLQEHRDLGYPVFARDLGTTAPYELVKVVATQTSVKLQTAEQDMTLSSEDLIIADLNGVVMIPRGLIEQVIPLIQPQVDADERMAEAIKGGMSFTEAGKKFRTTFEVGGKAFSKQEGQKAEVA